MKPRALTWTNTALRDLRALDLGMARRIVDAMDRFATSGLGDVRKLGGRDDEYRLRVGDYRILFEVSDATILVLRVLNRREAYR